MGKIETSNFVRKLAANDRPTRLAALESLKKFLTAARDLPLIEFEKLWKGLFYAMWFSDKPRPQQRLAADLASLFEIIPKKNYAAFSLAFWLIITREWPGIDHHRLDKFLLLVRRVLKAQIKKLQTENWDEKLIEQYLANLKKVPLADSQKIPAGVTYHVVDVYADELEKVMFEDLEEDDEDDEEDDTNIEKRIDIIESTPLEQLLEPFYHILENSTNKTLKEKIQEELIEDPRLKTWGLTGGDDSDVSGDESEDDKEEAEDQDSDDDWKGFA